MTLYVRTPMSLARRMQQEMKSEYENPEYAGIVTRLKAELDKLKEKYQVPAHVPLENNPDA